MKQVQEMNVLQDKVEEQVMDTDEDASMMEETEKPIEGAEKLLKDELEVKAEFNVNEAIEEHIAIDEHMNKKLEVFNKDDGVENVEIEKKEEKDK